MNIVKDWTVAVTGVNGAPGLALARCLRRSLEFRGRLVGLSREGLEPGLLHGLLDAGGLLPEPLAAEGAMLDRILELDDVCELDAVIPCLNEEFPAFLRIAHELARAGIRTLLPRCVAFRALSRERLGAFCGKLGMAVPRTLRVADASFFDHRRQWPLVVRGRYFGSQVVDNAAAARDAFWRLVGQAGLVIVQPYVRGQELSLTGLGDGRGTLTGPMGISIKSEGGWMEAAEGDAELEGAAMRIVETTRWTGPLELRVRRAEDGVLWILEATPRFPAWLASRQGAVSRLPDALLGMMAGQPDQVIGLAS